MGQRALPGGGVLRQAPQRTHRRIGAQHASDRVEFPTTAGSPSSTSGTGAAAAGPGAGGKPVGRVGVSGHELSYIANRDFFIALLNEAVADLLNAQARRDISQGSGSAC
ncbi:hypothetical protein ACFVT2_39330 [Streptomyces sp. NPDC058000]|uniref:hypothetical protein n=1 Tax=Streptomyces sp. NPDC058000 TaxID=3346299 RepID=UPI0036E44D37